MTDQSPTMDISTAPTLGTPRDLRARVMLALISTTTAKPNAGRAAALVEEARTIMAFITGDASASDPGEVPAAPIEGPAEA